MTEVNIRSAAARDIAYLASLDHNYSTEYVWQMDFQFEDSKFESSFKMVRLPRSVRVEYPRIPENLLQDWTKRSGLLVASISDNIVGYISIRDDQVPLTTWVSDLVVGRRVRRQGVGTALLAAAQDWGNHKKTRNIVLEMQPKNFPGIKFALKNGFEFCGYNDRYYANRDLGLFFAKYI